MKAKEKKDISKMIKNLMLIRKEVGWETSAIVDDVIKKQISLLTEEINSEFELKENAKKYNV